VRQQLRDHSPDSRTAGGTAARLRDFDRCAAAATAMSATPAVEMLNFQRGSVDVVEAARIDRDHRSLRTLAASEGPDAARFAEHVVDVSLPELVIGERFLAFLELERIGGNERKQRTRA
jgi:hypothetical protein